MKCKRADMATVLRPICAVMAAPPLVASLSLPVSWWARLLVAVGSLVLVQLITALLFFVVLSRTPEPDNPLLESINVPHPCTQKLCRRIVLSKAEFFRATRDRIDPSHQTYGVLAEHPHVAIHIDVSEPSRGDRSEWLCSFVSRCEDRRFVTMSAPIPGVPAAMTVGFRRTTDLNRLLQDHIKLVGHSPCEKPNPTQLADWVKASSETPKLVRFPQFFLWWPQFVLGSNGSLAG